jgi:hypothetical protein
MADRLVSEVEVRDVLENGETIEEDRDGEPYPGRVILGWIEGRPLHVVVAEDEAEKESIVVTVYEPNPERWTDGFRRRRKP